MKGRKRHTGCRDGTWERGWGEEGGRKGRYGAEGRGIEEEVKEKINEGKPGDGVWERKEWR